MKKHGVLCVQSNFKYINAEAFITLYIAILHMLDMTSGEQYQYLNVNSEKYDL